MVAIRVLLLASILLVVSSAAVSAGTPDTFQLEVPVLMYHRISPPPRDAALPDLWVRPADFRAQLTALQRAGWRTVTAAEVAQHLRDREPLPARSFVISIDDGARDGYTNAAPILRALGMRATFYVTPGRVGRPWQLTWPMLRELHAEGHEIANHSMTHAALTALSDDSLRRQIVRAQELIETKVGLRPITFAYPFGYHDARVRRAVRAAGLRLAFTTAWGAVTDTAPRMKAPRVRVHASDSGGALLVRLRRLLADGSDVRVEAQVVAPSVAEAIVVMPTGVRWAS